MTVGSGRGAATTVRTAELFFGLLLAGPMLLREPIAWSMVAAIGLIALCIAGTKRFA